ncbi:MAG: hypothetical protein HY047_16960 [Acidobacteria bacterium]|nr:hypothetical protein [Acidobacteriota bacterium]
MTTTLYLRLGIADEMAGKTTTSGVAAVARGDAEIGLQRLNGHFRELRLLSRARIIGLFSNLTEA